MLASIRRYYGFEAHGTNFQREIIAGVTTFMTMSYIIVVNPAILKVAGLPFEPSMVATILTALFGTLLMGVYAKRPYAIAPYMGENAFIAFTVVKVLGYSWQTALGAVFIGGLLLVVLTALKARQWLTEAVPPSLRYSFAVGIGLFLTFIGLNTTGIIVLGSSGVPVKIGNFVSPNVLTAIFGFLMISVLMIRRIPGAILLGILSTTVVSFFTGVAKVPDSWVSLPPNPAPIVLQLDILGALTWGFFPVILTIFILDFLDTMATLIGLSARAGFLDQDGNLPQIERPMMVDALSTVFAALMGTTTAGAYIESATGVEVGGRTGFTAVVIALLFAVSLFFAPFVRSVPGEAYGPALIVAGLLMLQPITRINFDDYTELIPSFAVVILMSFTYNIGIGITGGFVLYPFCKVVAGRQNEVRPGLWVLALLSIVFFLFYPYA